jgi:DNA-binding CsgD family transcriptional regulator
MRCGRSQGKILSPAAKRRAVDMLKDTLSMSERLACKAVGLARSTYRGPPVAPTPADPDAEMRAWLRAYATKHPCHGFRRAWAAVGAVRDGLGHSDFESAWAEGATMSTLEAIAYARRGHGDRKRPTSGWRALTPTERDVVRLVSEGLANKDIATRLFISPRTVQSHLTHVYNKLGVSSRVQLVREAARHN